MTKSFRKKVLFLTSHFHAQRPTTGTTIQSTGELTGDPVPALYIKTLINGTRIPILYSWVGPSKKGGVWGGNPIEMGLAAEDNFPNICLHAGYVPHMCRNVLSSLEWRNPGLKSVRDAK